MRPAIPSQQIVQRISRKPHVTKRLTSNSLLFEELEERHLLAVVTWDGDANLDWNNPLNWDTDTLPGTNDDVVIPDVIPDITITHTSGGTSIKSLTSSESLVISGGQFIIAQSSTISGALTLAGGTLTSNAVISLNGNFTWFRGTLTGAGKTIANGGLLITGTLDTMRL